MSVTEEPADDRRPDQVSNPGGLDGAQSSVPEEPGLPDPGPGLPDPQPDQPGWPAAARAAGSPGSPNRPDTPRQPRSSGASSRKSGPSRQSASSGSPRRPGQSDRSRGPGAQGSDLLNEFQRWLIRSSAKNLRREVGGQVRRTLGTDRAKPQDVWSTVTTEPPPGQAGEAPECAWCPVCRAARRLRESGPGVGSQLAGAGDAVALAVTDALEALNAALSRAGRPDQPAQPGTASPEGPEHGPDDRG